MGDTYAHLTRTDDADLVDGVGVESASRCRIGAKRGAFGARMEVELVNDGPVTLLLEA